MKHAEHPRFAAVILAAGSSSRMGRPKLSLPFQGESLIRRTVLTALAAGCSPVAVVLGAFAAEYQPLIADLPIRVVLNPNWESGMGSSLRCGVAAIQNADPDGAGTFLLTADQPFVSADLLRGMREAIGDAPTLGCRYAGTVGVPALFRRSRFEALLTCDDTVGARKLLRSTGEAPSAYDFPQGSFDVDTPEAYAELLKFDFDRPLPE